VRIIYDLDVGTYPFSLNNERRTIGRKVREFGFAHITSVDEWKRSTDANDTTPCALADQGSDTIMPELPRKQVAVRGRILIDETYLGADVCIGFDRGSFVVTAHGSQTRPAKQSFNNHWRHIATAVAPVVDDQGFLIKLGIEIASKLIKSIRYHVGDMYVTNPSVAGGRYFCNILLNPFVI